MTLDEATRRLERWTQSLLDLVPRDRLVDRVETDEAFVVPFDRALDVRVRELVLPASAARALTTPRADGDHVAWLAIGAVWWSTGDARVRRAPLVLAPVAIERSRTSDAIVARRLGAARLNTSLFAALAAEADLALELGAIEPLADLPAAFALVTERVAEARPAWAVERAAYVTTFSLAPVALAADLARPEIAAAPLVRRWLVAEPTDVLPAGPAPALPLDADADQLAVATAALAGHSVAVAAPPGTGAAQTAANIAAAAMAEGKTVLVVSTRAAALDAVRDRLAATGVGEFALALDIVDDAGRVSRALAEIADRTWRPGGAAVGAIDRREQVAAALDGYAAALHHRTPAGISMFEAVARLVELRTSPRLPPTAIDLAGLDPAELGRRRAALTTYARAATAVAPIAAHPWRASTAADVVEGPGTAAVADALAGAEIAAEVLGRRLGELSALIPGLAPRSRADLEAAGALFAIAAKTPRPGADLIAAGPPPATDEVKVDPFRALPASAIPRDPAAYVALARRQRKLRDELAQRWTPAIAQLELDGLAEKFRAGEKKGAFSRWAALRAPRATVRAVLAGDKLPDDLTIAADLDTAAEERAARRLLGEAAGPARRWFGQLAGVRDASDLPDLDALDLDQVDAALWWARDLRAAFDAVPMATPRGSPPRPVGEAAGVPTPPSQTPRGSPPRPDGEAAGVPTPPSQTPRGSARDAAWRALIAQVCAPHDRARADAEVPDAPFAEAAAAVDAWMKALAALADAAGVAIGTTLDGGDRGHLAALADQIAAWRGALGHLPAWSEYVGARSAARAAGLAAVVTACESGQLATEQAVDAWERAVLLAVIADRIASSPSLAQFHGPSQHARAVELGDLTRAAQLAVRSRSLARLADRVPRAGIADDATAVLAAERARATPRTARELLVDVEELMPRLAPCVFATPAAVAEHLDPARAPFDVAILLAAGSMPAAVALGALARSRAVVAFGTEREGSAFAEASARFPNLALGTHYRSRHEDLFAFANVRWFGDRLVVFPAPAVEPGRGTSLRIFDGDVADAAVAAVLAHLRDPDARRRSLAVIGFERDVVARIDEQLAAARAVDPTLDRFFAAAPAPAPADDEERVEPVLVAEATDVEAAARDVVLVAVAQATDPEGLATAVTGAREQLVILSTVAPEAAAGELGELLAYARACGARGAAMTEEAPASPLTAAIGAALVARGWSVRHRVGAGPYRIDLAVLDPDDPTRFVLGIETDGAAYASAAAAGDRDRLRGQVLAERGWRLHRIWCLDWWTDPDREAQRANGAVIAAIAAARQARRPAQPRSKPRWTRPSLTSPPPAVGGDTAPSAAPQDGSGVAVAAGSAPAVARGSRPTGARSPQLLAGLAARMSPRVAPYQAASVPAGRRRPDDMFEARHADELGKLIDRVLEVEAPIHLGLLARRVAAYFGVGKVTPRITEQVRAALAGRGLVGDEPDVVWRLDQEPGAPVTVRVFAEAIESKRDIDEVPLVEIAGAATVVVDRAPGVAIPELVRDAARLLGFARITDRVLERVRSGVELAGTTGAIQLEGDRARRA